MELRKAKTPDEMAKIEAEAAGPLLSGWLKSLFLQPEMFVDERSLLRHEGFRNGMSFQRHMHHRLVPPKFIVGGID